MARDDFKMDNARLFVLKLLIKMENNGYSNIILDKALLESDMTLQDKKFASSLFYGVIERKITLDFIIKRYLSIPFEKIDKDILQILRMGFYQLVYMNSVPESAAVNESVNLAKSIRKKSAAGFVNAVLRNFIRDNNKINFPENKLEHLSIKYSCPLWLVQKWISEYGEENIESLLQSTVAIPETALRVNVLKTSTDELLEKLSLENISAKKHESIPNCLLVKSGDLESLKSFKDGLFHVQDISSQLCCMALNPKEGEVVLDMCAAPGGKSFTLAQLMNSNGIIYAFDLHEKRVNLIRKGAERLGIDCIKAGTGDAREFNPNIPLADKILCDVPCAGLGVISKKPEIKYKNPDELGNLPEIQYNILKNASRYLKPGGEIVYSTCSLSREENDEVADRFLRENSDFSGKSFLEGYGGPFGNYKATILPADFNSDGFFIAKFVKKNNV